MPKSKSSYNTMNSCLFNSFTQVECQPEENEDDKSEEKSQEKTKDPLGWCLQTDGNKQFLSASYLDLIR